MPMTAERLVRLAMPSRPNRRTSSPAPTAKSTPNKTLPSPYPASSPATSSIRHQNRRTGIVLAQVGAAHMRVGADRGRRPSRNDAALDHDGDAVGQREHRVHIVLDQADR